MVAPSEIDLEDYNLSFCQVQDYNVSKLIEEKISAFESAISGTRTNNATVSNYFTVIRLSKETNRSQIERKKGNGKTSNKSDFTFLLNFLS